MNQVLVLHQNNHRFDRLMPVNTGIMDDHIPILINTRLPIDELIINNALGCLFSARMRRKTKQLQKLPMVLMMIMNKPKVLHKRSPTLDK